MKKKIAILVRDRQDEALRMAVGMILLDDEIDIFVLDRRIVENENNSLYLETIRDMEMKAWSNIEDNCGLPVLSIKEIAEKLPEYDHVLAY